MLVTLSMMTALASDVVPLTARVPSQGDSDHVRYEVTIDLRMPTEGQHTGTNQVSTDAYFEVRFDVERDANHRKGPLYRVNLLRVEDRPRFGRATPRALQGRVVMYEPEAERLRPADGLKLDTAASAELLELLQGELAPFASLGDQLPSTLTLGVPIEGVDVAGLAREIVVFERRRGAGGRTFIDGRLRGHTEGTDGWSIAAGGRLEVEAGTGWVTGWDLRGTGRVEDEQGNVGAAVMRVVVRHDYELTTGTSLQTAGGSTDF